MVGNELKLWFVDLSLRPNELTYLVGVNADGMIGFNTYCKMAAFNRHL